MTKGETQMDDEWVALVAEARSLGLTTEEIREWIDKTKAEAVINE
jgi:DNA-binding transcriptional MerR regulator